MTATHEIEVLQSLKGDTYFAQVFKPETIDAMCENIRKDYQIDCGVDVFENCHSAIVARKDAKLNKGLLDEANGTIESLLEQKHAMTEIILRLLYENGGTSAYDDAEKYLDTHVGRKEIIKRKIKMGLTLSNVDQDWLLNNL